MRHWFGSFRIRLTVLFGGLSLLAGLGIALYVAQAATVRMSAAVGDALLGIGRTTANALAETLMEREREIVLISKRPLFVHADFGDAELRRSLEQAKHTYRHYAWMGIADADGMVRVEADGLLEGEKVAQRPWFQGGREGAFIGDVHDAVLLAKKIRAPNPDEPLRFVDFAAPIHGADGRLRGVVAAHAHWSWAGEVLRSSLATAGEGVEAFVVNAAGEIIYPYEHVGRLALPAALPDSGGYARVDWDDGEPFLTARAAMNSTTDLGWQVVVRQPVAKALAPVSELHRTLLVLGGAVAVAFMFLAYRLAAAFSRPVEALAGAAQRVEQGDEETPFDVRSDIREVRMLADSLRGMTARLLGRRRELQEINATLERKVEARTAELAAANRALEKLARSDALTGLANRLAANERLHGEFLRMQRTGVRYAVLLMDVDHFKRVNDTYGHEVGDRVLRHVAGIAADSARATDFVARFGGEEFFAILPDTDLAGALVVAEKIRAAVADAAAPVVGQVTLSVGVAQATPDDASEDDAVNLADRHLYRAKAEGRNRVAAADRLPDAVLAS
ncbi:MAG: diguanylate cyclase [Rhodocyclaceae bacterium]|nr:diguanylate cyclase [Rhodocyclaceae bacterium]